MEHVASTSENENYDPDCYKESQLQNLFTGYVEDCEDNFSPDLDDKFQSPGIGVNKLRPNSKHEVEKVAPSLTSSKVIKNKLCGIMLIFNQKRYILKEEERRGSSVDVVNAEKAFKRLGFEVHVYNDFRNNEITKKVQEKLKDTKIQSRSSFGITLMGHGEEDKFKTYWNTELSISELVTQVQETKALEKIPKLFFIQACRGEKRMKHVAYRVENKTPLRADTIVHYATYEGYKAFRSPNFKSGGKKICSWFIYALAKVVDQMQIGEKIEIHGLLTKINEVTSQFVADYATDKKGQRIEGEFCQMPEFRSTMRHYFELEKLNEDEGTFYKVMMAYGEKTMQDEFKRLMKISKSLTF